MYSDDFTITRRDEFKKSLLASAFVSIAAQIHINLLLTNFKISLAIILFPIFLYIFEDLNIILTTIFSSLGVYFLRVLVHFINTGIYSDILYAYSPEIFFYLTYGFLFSMHKKINFKFKIQKIFINFIVIDYLANLVEITIRLGTDIFDFKIQQGIFLVAIIRSFLIWVLLTSLDYYGIFLLKNEHEQRYKKLLWVTSKLKSEIFWMEKNMYHIENTMSTSYKLFEKITNNIDSETWADSALTIAKDIHEIKKEYSLVVRGVKDTLEDKLNDNGIYLKEIIKILKESMEKEIEASNKHIKLHFHIERDFFTEKHYYLMSIFRNLIINAIESIKNKDKNNSIWFIHFEEEQHHIFKIQDTGTGIKDEYLNLIFSPGFSTKINYTTGQINRGLGLSLVKDIITKELKGEIQVNSTIEKGTTFTVVIPKNILEGI
ncbi:MAG: GHKL domain-containing protein [Clostridium argentinense]|uniref:histidine kinase n=1 Tax=Clostridium faecium TaxID=2762223 RepID=A0ABR8YWK8_9CLOT|nr:ATP-binding protein [Clostridium faecium]MBD8048610.1 GHKL domain-containing protein [Clostridium faecium]MBS5822641.1 GHKL domain-containing protein [Clostridium argentinense]MDU1347794.1 ATP-binding protein [Clostridium argentinense]